MGRIFRERKSFAEKNSRKLKSREFSKKSLASGVEIQNTPSPKKGSASFRVWSRKVAPIALILIHNEMYATLDVLLSREIHVYRTKRLSVVLHLSAFVSTHVHTSTYDCQSLMRQRNVCNSRCTIVDRNTSVNGRAFVLKNNRMQSKCLCVARFVCPSLKRANCARVEL